MNIREMHIEISQASQNIAANTRRKLQDPEMDWLLNKVQERFIQSKVRARKDGNGGFEVDQMGADSIRPLLTRFVTVPSVGSNEEYHAQLPADYSYLISDDSKTLALCGTAAPQTVADSLPILVLPFKFSTLQAAPFYASMSLTFGSVTILLSDITSFYQSSYSGTRSKDEKFLLRDLFLWYIRNVQGTPVYWERYGMVYAPNSFLFVSLSSGNITVDGTTVQGTVQTLAREYYQDAGKWVPNRLSPTDRISTMLATPYIGSDARSPISSIEAQRLTIYGNESFIVTGTSMDYIRKPRKMDLLLNSDCELPEEFHQAICDLTVEYFKAMTADPNWEVKLKDNMLRSVNV